MDIDYIEACRIHGIMNSDSDSDSEGKTEFDEEYNLLKPPLINYESIKDRIVVVSPEKAVNVWQERLETTQINNVGKENTHITETIKLLKAKTVPQPNVQTGGLENRKAIAMTVASTSKKTKKGINGPQETDSYKYTAMHEFYEPEMLKKLNERLDELGESIWHCGLSKTSIESQLDLTRKKETDVLHLWKSERNTNGSIDEKNYEKSSSKPSETGNELQASDNSGKKKKKNKLQPIIIEPVPSNPNKKKSKTEPVQNDISKVHTLTRTKETDVLHLGKSERNTNGSIDEKNYEKSSSKPSKTGNELQASDNSGKKKKKNKFQPVIIEPVPSNPNKKKFKTEPVQNDISKVHTLTRTKETDVLHLGKSERNTNGSIDEKNYEKSSSKPSKTGNELQASDNSGKKKKKNKFQPIIIEPVPSNPNKKKFKTEPVQNDISVVHTLTSNKETDVLHLWKSERNTNGSIDEKNYEKSSSKPSKTGNELQASDNSGKKKKNKFQPIIIEPVPSNPKKKKSKTEPVQNDISKVHTLTRTKETDVLHLWKLEGNTNGLIDEKNYEKSSSKPSETGNELQASDNSGKKKKKKFKPLIMDLLSPNPKKKKSETKSVQNDISKVDTQIIEKAKRLLGNNELDYTAMCTSSWSQTNKTIEKGAAVKHLKNENLLHVTENVTVERIVGKISYRDITKSGTKTSAGKVKKSNDLQKSLDKNSDTVGTVISSKQLAEKPVEVEQLEDANTTQSAGKKGKHKKKKKSSNTLQNQDLTKITENSTNAAEVLENNSSNGNVTDNVQGRLNFSILNKEITERCWLLSHTDTKSNLSTGNTIVSKLDKKNKADELQNLKNNQSVTVTTPTPAGTEKKKKTKPLTAQKPNSSVLRDTPDEGFNHYLSMVYGNTKIIPNLTTLAYQHHYRSYIAWKQRNSMIAYDNYPLTAGNALPQNCNYFRGAGNVLRYNFGHPNTNLRFCLNLMPQINYSNTSLNANHIFFNHTNNGLLNSTTATTRTAYVDNNVASTRGDTIQFFSRQYEDVQSQDRAGKNVTIQEEKAETDESITKNNDEVIVEQTIENFKEKVVKMQQTSENSVEIANLMEQKMKEKSEAKILDKAVMEKVWNLPHNVETSTLSTAAELEKATATPATVNKKKKKKRRSKQSSTEPSKSISSTSLEVIEQEQTLMKENSKDKTSDNREKQTPKLLKKDTVKYIWHLPEDIDTELCITKSEEGIESAPTKKSEEFKDVTKKKRRRKKKKSNESSSSKELAVENDELLPSLQRSNDSSLSHFGFGNNELYHLRRSNDSLKSCSSTKPSSSDIHSEICNDFHDNVTSIGDQQHNNFTNGMATCSGREKDDYLQQLDEKRPNKVVRYPKPSLDDQGCDDNSTCNDIRSLQFQEIYDNASNNMKQEMYYVGNGKADDPAVLKLLRVALLIFVANVVGTILRNIILMLIKNIFYICLALLFYIYNKYRT